MTDSPVTSEYEVFSNNQNALAFFMNRHSSLDKNGPEGPFFFSIHEDNNIVAGTEENHAIFPGVSPEIIQTAKERKVIMLMEFENQQAYRCTPCYFIDAD